MVYSVSCWTCDYSACFIYKSLQHDFQITLKWVHLICSLLPCFAVCLYFPSLTLFSSTPLLFIPIPLSYSSSTSLLSSGLPSPRGVGQLWPTDSSLIVLVWIGQSTNKWLSRASLVKIFVYFSSDCTTWRSTLGVNFIYWNIPLQNQSCSVY